jgi:hypothetical protein
MKPEGMMEIMESYIGNTKAKSGLYRCVFLNLPNVVTFVFRKSEWIVNW